MPNQSASDPDQNPSNQAKPPPAQAAEDAQNVMDYSDLVVRTLTLVKQAERTVTDGTFGAPDTHSRIISAEALMGKASDLYDSQSYSIPGMSDVDVLMRDGI